jgi:lipid-A-disaccharide synthase
MALNNRLFIIAGDYSGDIHAAKVVQALREMQPNLEIAAVGGNHLQAANVELLSDQSKMGRVGFGGVMGAPYHYFLGKRILKFLTQFRPDAVLLVDYGGFNLHMAAQLKKQGFKVFYFIPPQVWATRKGRIRKIKAYVDHVFCIFPFELALYQSYEIPVTYVGHPLIGQLPPPVERAAFCREHGLNPHWPILGLFPGSRKLEIDYLLKAMIGSLPLIAQQQPYVQFVLAKAGSLSDAYFYQRLEAALQSLPRHTRPAVKVVENQNHALLSVSDAVILASGTVTLEAALYGTPMTVIYKLQPVVFQVAMFLLALPYISLPNILANMKVPIVQELLQRAVTPRAICEAMIPLLDVTSPQVVRQKAGFKQIQQELSMGEAPVNVAKGILALLAPSGEESTVLVAN